MKEAWEREKPEILGENVYHKPCSLSYGGRPACLDAGNTDGP